MIHRDRTTKDLRAGKRVIDRSVGISPAEPSPALLKKPFCPYALQHHAMQLLETKER